jgi:transcriptional regulator with XRE-family HTH domain
MRLGARLREERDRLKLTQPEMAALVGVRKGTQIAWEKGASAPDAAQLNVLLARGVDVIYVLSGLRVPKESLSVFRAAAQATEGARLRPDELEEVRRLNVEALIKHAAQSALSAEEARLIDRFRSATSEGRGTIKTVAESVASTGKRKGG